MKILLLILVSIHGIIHLLGFLKAFRFATVKQLSQDIPRKHGLRWLMSSILFVVTAALIFLQYDLWWIVATVAVILSQYLIITRWHDAKFGTVANGLMLVAIVIGYATWDFRHVYTKDVATSLTHMGSIQDSFLQEKDIEKLPPLVKKYIRYSGAVGKPKVKNFALEFKGHLRTDEQSDWMPFSSEQYNFLDSTKRLFFLKATMKHLPVQGYHYFSQENIFMDIRLLSLIRVQYQSGNEMEISETVTFFNDMCCMAPATLIDNRIKWLETDTLKVKASFTQNNITITAWLHFNPAGELINFISDDRYAVVEDGSMKRIPWSTPLREYREINGHKLAEFAETHYRYPSGDLCYGQFKLTNVYYNQKSLP